MKKSVEPSEDVFQTRTARPSRIFASSSRPVLPYDKASDYQGGDQERSHRDGVFERMDAKIENGRRKEMPEAPVRDEGQRDQGNEATCQ
nr:hypothetical protein [Bradyrhizobium tropiciagri]